MSEASVTRAAAQQWHCQVCRAWLPLAISKAAHMRLHAREDAARRQRDAVRGLGPSSVPERTTARKPPAPPRHPTIPLSLANFARRHGLVCTWCGEEVGLTVGRNHPTAPTREHLIPRSLGGSDRACNLALAHRRCNQHRGTMEAEAYRRLLRGEAVTAAEMWPREFGDES